MTDLEELLGAIARGWCHPENADKVMDGDLAEAIADEVFPLLVRARDGLAVTEDDESEPETFSWDRESATRQVATGELGTPRSESAIAYLSARHEPVYFGTEEW